MTRRSKIAAIATPVLVLGLLLGSAGYRRFVENREIRALQEGTEWQRAAAAVELGKMCSRRAVPVLALALEDDSLVVRIAVAAALGEMGSDAEEAVPGLVAAFAREDEEPIVRVAHATALEAIGPAAKLAVPALTDALGDESPFVRKSSAAALGGIGPDAESAVRALMEAQSDEDSSVRIAAERALERIRR